MVRRTAGALSAHMNGRPSVVLLFTAIGLMFFLAIGCQPDPVAQAIERLQSDSPEERVGAVQVLVQANTIRVAQKTLARVPDALQQALKDEYPAVRQIAARGIRKWGNFRLTAAAIQAMRQDLDANDEEIVTTAVEILTMYPDQEATDALITALASPFPEARARAAKAITARGVTLSGDDELRYWLITNHPENVAEKGPSVVPFLRGLLKSDPYYRAAAAQAIGMIGDADAIREAAPLVLDDLENEEPAVRVNAVNALGALGDESAIAPLQNLAKNDPNSEVRAAAMIAVYVLENDIVSLARTLEDADPTVQLMAIRGIRLINDKRPAIDSLIRLLRRTTNENVADEVITALGTCGRDAAKPLVDALADEDEWTLRLRIAKALNHERVFRGMSPELELALSELYEKEVNDIVRSQLAEVLNALES